MSKPRIAVAVISLLWLGIGESSPAYAGLVVSYQVRVNTALLSGQSGYLDVQFNPGDSSTELADVTVTDLQSVGGTVAGTAAFTGDASGLLPGTLMLDNGTPYNDIFQGVTYGQSFSLIVNLSGPAIDTPVGTFGSSFALSLYASDGITPQLTTDPNGSVVTLNLNADGTTAAEMFPQSATDTNPSGTAILVSPANPIPEPSTIVLVTSALPFGLIVWRCRPSSR